MAIREIKHEEFHLAQEWINSSKFNTNKSWDLEQGLYFILDDSGSAVGTICTRDRGAVDLIFPKPEDPSWPETISFSSCREITKLFVLPKHRGNRYASRAIQDLIDLDVSVDCFVARVLEYNVGTVNIFTKMGFQRAYNNDHFSHKIYWKAR